MVEGTRMSLVHFALDILTVAFGKFNHCHLDMDSPLFDEYNGTFIVSLLFDELNKSNDLNIANCNNSNDI